MHGMGPQLYLSSNPSEHRVVMLLRFAGSPLSCRSAAEFGSDCQQGDSLASAHDSF